MGTYQQPPRGSILIWAWRSGFVEENLES